MNQRGSETINSKSHMLAISSTLSIKSKPLRWIILIVSVRIASVFIIQSWYVPDEYWQSLEVAHNLVFGYGHITWEWKEGIRSYLHPLIIAFLYKVLYFLNLDTVFTLTVLPRIFQAILTSYGEFCLIRHFEYKKWIAFIFLSNWFVFYTGSRTLLNSVEYSLCLIALSKFPIYPDKVPKDDSSFLWVVALAGMVRPTAVIPWIPLCLYHLKYSKRKAVTLCLYRYFPICVIALFSVCVIDSFLHGTLIFTPWQFLKFNIIHNIGTFYGSHPVYWYFTIGLPTLLGFNTVIFMFALPFAIKKWDAFLNAIMLSIFVTMGVLSIIEHKEFRFLLPVLPMILLVISIRLAHWSRTASTALLVITASIIFLTNVIIALFLGLAHQRGNLDVMSELVNITNYYEGMDNRPLSVLFLLPCHSTPYTSHIHKNIDMRFLTCEPDLYNTGLQDEADFFYKNPTEWVNKNYPDVPEDLSNKAEKCLSNLDSDSCTRANNVQVSTWKNVNVPSHIVCFDLLDKDIEKLFPDFIKIRTIFSSIFAEGRVGKYINIYQRKPI